LRYGRERAVASRAADCCIDPAVRKSMDLDAGTAFAAVLLGEARQQRPP
jgi:hypothetical protein